jgi:HAE1 family hydrophobic/amphiphilic exporter-1
MAYAAVALLGVAAWRNIPIELLPDTELPRLTVTGTWRGASPETVEAFLTSPLESTVQQVAGVERITSESREENGVGEARIEVEFNRDTDMDFARLELSERLSALEEDLPPGVRNVQVLPYVPSEFEDQNQGFLRYRFTGPYTLEALHLHLDDVVVPELSQVDGVALVRVSGGRDRRLEIRVDEEQALALGLTGFDVWRAIGELDLVQEAGTVREGDGERTVTIVNRPETAADVRDAVLTTVNGTILRVSDVARVTDTWEDARLYQRVNGSPAVTMEVVREVGSNAVRTADAVKARLEQVSVLNPFDSRFILDQDESERIREQLSDLSARAAFAAVVIFIVLLVFLRSFRSAGLIFTTILFSVLISLNLIYFSGMTLNLLTLMGLALGFGLIVDNSIVVLENVYRRWQRGEDAFHAAEHGSREVVLPILASTATTLIVFVPFVYLQGELRVFYVPLAVVVGLTLIASLLVAFSFIPSLSARWLRSGVRTGGATVAGAVEGAAGQGAGGGTAVGVEAREPFYVGFYRTVVGFTLRHPWIAVGFTALCLGGSGYLFDRNVTRGVIWGGGGDGESYIQIVIRLPRGANLERTDQLVGFFEDKLSRIPEVESYSAQVFETLGFMEVRFPDDLQFTDIPASIKDEMLAYSYTFTGADVRVYGYGPSFYGGSSSPPTYSIVVLGYNFERVREIAEDIGARLSRINRVQGVDTNAAGRFTRDRASEFVVEVDRDALARYDMTVQDLVNQMQSAVAGESRLSFLRIAGEDVGYEVKVRDVEEMDLLALRETIVQTPDGRGIRLGEVVAIESRDVLSNIRRENQQYERRVAYEFRGPSRLGDTYRDAIIERTELPPGYTIRADERWRWDREEQEQIVMVLLVSLILVYMVTASLFESLRQPLAVLLTVPMALIGVFMIFFYSQATFTREAYIGVIMMGGIVVNNAILLVDHINGVRRTTELSLYDAVLRGTLERVRPILMTTATTVLGLLPLVLFAESQDANIWNALAYTLIGGLLSSTLFVLTTTPSVYYLFERGAEARLRAGGSRAGGVVPSAGPPAPGPGGGLPGAEPVAGD